MERAATSLFDPSYISAAAHASRPAAAGAVLANRPEVMAQREMAGWLNHGPKMVAQRKLLQGLFGKTAQLLDEDEKVSLPPARTVGPEPVAGATAHAAPGIVQRIVRIDGDNVLPDDHEALVAHCRDLVGETWTPFMEKTLRDWLVDRDHVFEAPSKLALASNLPATPDAAAAKLQHGMAITQIEPEAMDAARRVRNVERLARLTVPFETQTAVRVPGLGNLDNEDLLRLAETGEEEQQFWMRPSATQPDQVRNVKRRDISSEDEAHITAAGMPDDPSYVVAMNSHQLGHRYRGTDQKFIAGPSHERTYGSKREREGYEYKGSGLVDGHSVQVQDDQPILGPFQSDAQDWKTSIATTSGATETFEDAPYLPVDETDERWIEQHPHNFYWENQEQGKHMRQKALETPAMKDETSFLHYNRHTGDQFQPNAGQAQDHLYDVPSRIEYLTTDANGERTHFSVDNRPTADYSQPGGYDPVTHSYPSVPSGRASADENRTLGGVSAFDHLAMARMPDTTAFPFSTVLQPNDPGFRFEPPWRHEVPGYESPPGTPYYAGGGVDDDEALETGDQTLKRNFHHDGGLVTDAEYDEERNQTRLSVKRLKQSKPDSWSSSNEDPSAL